MGLNVALLESSFELLKPQADTLVNRFYERLFERYPAVKPMFARTTMPEQKKKLLGSLVLVMQNLRRPETLTPALKQLGARHVAYGTQPSHYGAVAETLLGVMGEMAGAAWTPEVKQAWTRCTQHNRTDHAGGRPRSGPASGVNPTRRNEDGQEQEVPENQTRQA